MPLEIDTLGTARFGATLARTIDVSATPLQLNIKAAELGVQMLSTRVNCGELDRIHALEADGHRLMDSLIYYTRSLRQPIAEGGKKTDLTIRGATKRARMLPMLNGRRPVSTVYPIPVRHS